MTDTEFDLLDELYFVINYAELQSQLGWPHEQMQQALQNLWQKGWLVCLHDPDNEVPPQEVNLGSHYRNYHYLASKAGLMAHNGH